MTVHKDWMMAAAEEINTKFLAKAITTDFTIVTIIRRHCPFEDGVAYMPVPRCETCKHWFERPPVHEVKAGECVALSVGNRTMFTAGDFGCIRWEAK